jgi:hypothetical protein
VKPSQFATLVFGVAVCLLLGLIVCGSQPLRAAVGDLLSLPEYTHHVENVTRQMRQLQVRSDLIRHRLALKSRAIADLLAGRCSLLETIRAFQMFDRETAADDAGQLPEGTPGVATDEPSARSVLSWAGADLRMRPNGEQEIRRLEQEMGELFRSGALRP